MLDNTFFRNEINLVFSEFDEAIDPHICNFDPSI